MHQLWLRYALIIVAIRLVSPTPRSANGLDTAATGTTVLTGLQGSIDSVVRSVSDSASWRISPSNPSAATVQFIFTAINMVRKFHRRWLSYLRRRWYQLSDSLSLCQLNCNHGLCTAAGGATNLRRVFRRRWSIRVQLCIVWLAAPPSLLLQHGLGRDQCERCPR